MVKPQQSELGVDGPGGRGVPDDNAPGHHPDHEQDKPSGRDFVAKTHALAHEDDYEPPSVDNEVLDLLPTEQTPTRSPVERALSMAGTGVGLGFKVVGTSLKVAGTVYREARKRLPTP